jgi:hypothetical protein
MIRRLLVQFFCAGVLIVGSVDASSQVPPVNTRSIAVKLSGISCQKVNNTIHAILNGIDQHPIALDRNGVGCEWRGRADKPFPLESSRFSLRLGGSRTPCSHAVGEKQQSVARLTFDYVPASAHDLTIDAQDERQEWVNIDYVRAVRNDSQCRDFGTLTNESVHSIADVNERLEDLRLHFPKMPRGDPGLLVNDKAVLKKTKKPHAVLSDVEIVNALQSQSKRAKRGTPPNDAIAARMNDERMLRESRLKHLKITVP